MSESEEETSSITTNDWPITEEWLLTVLNHHHKSTTISINEFHVKPGCEIGESVLSDILAVSVNYSYNNTTSHLNFIIKLLPQDPFSRFFVTEAQFDLREIKFYTQVVPDLEQFVKKQNCDLVLPIPRCYYAHYTHHDDNDTINPPPESVLVLENIKSLNYKSANFLNGLKLNETYSALEAIAHFHAITLSYKILEKKNLKNFYPFLFQIQHASNSYQQLVEKGLPQLSQFLELQHGLENIKMCLENLKLNVKDLIENLLEPIEPIALITHTDFWCNNLMFLEKPNDDGTEYACRILDWQMVTYSRPTNDIALLLISSLSAELRRLHTKQLLDFYWMKFYETCKLLQLNIEDELNYNRTKLDEDYRKSQLLALLLCIGSVDLALGNKLMEERLLALLQDLYDEGLLNADLAKN